MEHFDRFDRNVIWTRFAMRFANIRNLYTEKRRREGKACRVWIRVEFASMFVRAIEKFVEDAARWTKPGEWTRVNVNVPRDYTRINPWKRVDKRSF